MSWRLELDSFKVPLHSPAVRAVQRDCHWGLKIAQNSHWPREPIMQRGTRQSQSILRSSNNKSAMSTNWRPCLIPHWQSYCHQARAVQQSRLELIWEKLAFLTYTKCCRTSCMEHSRNRSIDAGILACVCQILLKICIKTTFLKFMMPRHSMCGIKKCVNTLINLL